MSKRVLKYMRRKILVLECFPLWGCGSGTYARCLAKELAQKKSNQVAVLSPESKMEKGARNIPYVKSYPLELPFPVAFTSHPEWPVVRQYKDLSPKEIGEVFRSFLASTMEAVEDFKPDILHVQHISLLLWVANFVKSLYDINFATTAHGTGIFTASKNKNYLPLSQDALRRAKKIIGVSKDTKDRLLATFGEEFSRKTRIIPGGIDLGDFPKKIKIKTIGKKYKLGRKKIVLFTGKVTEEKGVEHLIKAAKDINGWVYIIGDGPELNKLKEMSSKLNIGNVRFLGYMGKEQENELNEFYYRADVFVAPSVVAEALGLTILEAMAARTPVVATRRGGIPLAVKSGINGILVRAGSHKQIAEAVNKILASDGLREKMGQKAREMVEKKFTWAKIAQRYERVYKESILNGGKLNGKQNGRQNGKQNRK